MRSASSAREPLKPGRRIGGRTGAILRQSPCRSMPLPDFPFRRRTPSRSTALPSSISPFPPASLVAARYPRTLARSLRECPSVRRRRRAPHARRGLLPLLRMAQAARVAAAVVVAAAAPVAGVARAVLAMLARAVLALGSLRRNRSSRPPLRLPSLPRLGGAAGGVGARERVTRLVPPWEQSRRWR